MLDPAFLSGTTSYAASVTGGTATTRVTAITTDSQARLTINGDSTASGTASDPIALVIGETAAGSDRGDGRRRQRKNLYGTRHADRHPVPMPGSIRSSSAPGRCCSHSILTSSATTPPSATLLRPPE